MADEKAYAICENMSLEETMTKQQMEGAFLKSDSIEILYGHISIPAGTADVPESQSIYIPYPDGFTQFNCIPIAFGLVYDENYTTGINFFGTYASLQDNLVSSANRAILLTPDNIRMRVTSPSGLPLSFAFKLVLLKLPEPDISGYQLGDVNMNGKVNKTDVNMVANYDIQKEDVVLNSKQFKLADATGNGRLTADDCRKIQLLPYYEDKED